MARKQAEQPHVGVVSCPTCGLNATVTDPNGAIDRYRRHHSVTGHALKWERTALGTAVETTNVESALDTLGDEYAEGVPIGVLTAALTERNVTIEETLQTIYDLRMEGAIYEPRDDHFLVV